ncbi:MAG: serine hydrolase [Candidatus Pacebacteria bacterium]|nr:serine hydrolase [Candidatus Paceibacterota bacterium]
MQYRHRAHFSLAARVVIAIGILVIGIAIGQYSDTFLPGAPKTFHDVTDLADGYRFIDPLLFCSDHNLSGQTAAFSQRLQNNLTSIIDRKKQAGELNDASVLYRDLSNGPRVSVNPDLQSSPASLLKVPLALSIMRRAETDPAFLQKKVLMNIPDQNGGEHFTAPKKAEPEREYTIEELIDLSLINSDNNATDLLIMQLSDRELRKSYEDLGIQVPTDGASAYTMNVGVYGSFFRILYNASYLSRDNSEAFLSDLAGSTFTQGIVAGIPQGVTVAHKFGEYGDASGLKQLHDCGIIYRPNRPYLLCVMTQGKDFDVLAGAIRDISKTAWEAGE